MSTSGISIAVIGAGGFGAYHLNAIRSLRDERGIKLVAVADPNIDRMYKETAELGKNGVRLYSDYAEMLSQEASLDAVTITAPIPFHAEMVSACLQKNVFVYLEKPPVPLIQQLDELIEADSRERVCVGFQQITGPPIQQLKRWIAGGNLGEIKSIRVGASWPRRDVYYRRSPWAGKMMLQNKPVFDGPATNALAHLIHNMMYLAGEGLENFAVPTEVRGELYRARPIESYDVASLRGSFASGIEFSAALTHASETELPFRIEVSGSRGRACLSQDGRRLESSTENRDYPLEGCGDNRLRGSYQCFFDFVEGKRERAVTRLRDTRGYVLTTNGMLKSSGGIHQLAPKWVRKYAENGDAGYDVQGLPEAIAESLKSGKVFSELNIPWAVESTVVPLMEIKESPSLTPQPANGRIAPH